MQNPAEILARYLESLDDEWSDFEPAQILGPAALPHFISAFHSERDTERRAKLIRIIWQFRIPEVFLTLADALNDREPEVWKDALDGLVCLGGESAMRILAQSRLIAAAKFWSDEKVEWIDEAIEQIKHGMFPDQSGKGG